MRSWLLGVTVLIFLTSCQGAKDPAAENGGLSADEYNRIKSINAGIGDNKAAIQLAFGSPWRDDAPGSVPELAALIQAGGCVRDNKLPANAYDQSWSAHHYVQGPNCPITWLQDWSYDVRSRTWKVDRDEFTINSTDYGKKSPIQSFSMKNGFLTASRGDGSTKISGAFNFYNFKVKGIGLVLVNIRTTQTYGPVRGGGTLELTMESRRQIRAKVLISWYTGREPLYRLNGKVVDKMDIEDLFSSFKLTELIDRSNDMRY